MGEEEWSRFLCNREALGWASWSGMFCLEARGEFASLHCQVTGGELPQGRGMTLGNSWRRLSWQSSAATIPSSWGNGCLCHEGILRIHSSPHCQFFPAVPWCTAHQMPLKIPEHSTLDCAMLWTHLQFQPHEGQANRQHLVIWRREWNRWPNWAHCEFELFCRHPATWADAGCWGAAGNGVE